MATTKTTDGTSRPKGSKATKAKTKAKSPASSNPKAKGSARKSSPAVYTDPDLRDRLKDEFMAGEKGGKDGEWSARKSQLLASEYKKAGGGYRKDKKTESQDRLDQWTDEDWTTRDGKPAIRDGETARYLPEEAWDSLTPEQREATDSKKRAASKRGKQSAANTSKAKAARKKASARSEPKGKRKSSSL